MKHAMRQSAIIFVFGLILTGVLVGFSAKQDVISDSAVQERVAPDRENWDIDVLDTAKDADYLTGIEKDVILEMNMARTDPKKYAELYIQPQGQYFKGKKFAKPGQTFIMTQEGQDVVKECVEEMTKTEPVGVLTPEKGLSLAAKDHAVDQGKTGQMGHTGSDESDPFDRIERYGDSLTAAGENIAYGPVTGRDIVTQLLIDDGVPDRSHRVNIMKSDFAQAGIAFGTHPKFRAMCAISYARNYRTKAETLTVETSKKEDIISAEKAVEETAVGEHQTEDIAQARTAE